MIDFVNPAERGAKVFSANIDAIAEAIMFTSSSIQVNESNKSLIDNLLVLRSWVSWIREKKHAAHLRNFVIAVCRISIKTERNATFPAPDIQRYD